MLDPAIEPYLMSVVVAAVFVLIWGGVRVWRSGDRKKGVLMMICALVIFGNLLIWTL